MVDVTGSVAAVTVAVRVGILLSGVGFGRTVVAAIRHTVSVRVHVVVVEAGTDVAGIAYRIQIRVSLIEVVNPGAIINAVEGLVSGWG